MYQIGDHIFYPMHGAGRIEAIEEKEIAGEKRHYYIIHMMDDNMQVMIPKERMSKLNIRPVSDMETVKNIITMLGAVEQDEDLPWKIRYKAHEDMIKTGTLGACVDVVQGLFHIRREEKLNPSEKQLLRQAEKLLMSELKLVEGMNKEKRDKFISRLKENEAAIS